jgi:hypothetical protein
MVRRAIRIAKTGVAPIATLRTLLVTDQENLTGGARRVRNSTKEESKSRPREDESEGGGIERLGRIFLATAQAILRDATLECET